MRQNTIFISFFLEGPIANENKVREKKTYIIYKYILLMKATKPKQLLSGVAAGNFVVAKDLHD